MTQLDAVSFFAVLLILSPFVATGLWNVSVRNTSLRPVGFASGGLFALCWMFFVTTMLVVIEAFRNMLEPGLWARERLFTGLEPGTVFGAESPWMNLLCGWFLFPLRILPQVRIEPEGIAVAVVALLLTLLLIECLGRRIVGRNWRTRWTVTGTAAFAWLDVMTYATVALVRQTLWMF